MARRVLTAEVSGRRVRGRPRLGWMDGVKVALGNRNDSGSRAKDRKEWRALVHMQLNEFHAAIFACHCVISDRPPVLWWLSHGEETDAVRWCGWDKLWKGRNYWKSRLRCQVYGLRGVSWCLCVCFIWLAMTTPPRCREKVMVYYYLFCVCPEFEINTLYDVMYLTLYIIIYTQFYFRQIYNHL